MREPVILCEREVALDLEGLGILLFSPYAGAHIGEGQDYLTTNDWDPARSAVEHEPLERVDWVRVDGRSAVGSLREGGGRLGPGLGGS